MMRADQVAAAVRTVRAHVSGRSRVQAADGTAVRCANGRYLEADKAKQAAEVSELIMLKGQVSCTAV